MNIDRRLRPTSPGLSARHTGQPSILRRCSPSTSIKRYAPRRQISMDFFHLDSVTPQKGSTTVDALNGNSEDDSYDPNACTICMRARDDIWQTKCCRHKFCKQIPIYCRFSHDHANLGWNRVFESFHIRVDRSGSVLRINML